MTPEQITAVYTEGMTRTDADLAGALGVGVSAVKYQRRKLGLRKRAGRPRKLLSAEALDRIVTDLHRSTRALAAELGCSPSTVQYYRKRAGLSSGIKGGRPFA